MRPGLIGLEMNKKTKRLSDLTDAGEPTSQTDFQNLPRLEESLHVDYGYLTGLTDNATRIFIEGFRQW